MNRSLQTLLMTGAAFAVSVSASASAQEVGKRGFERPYQREDVREARREARDTLRESRQAAAPQTAVEARPQPPATPRAEAATPRAQAAAPRRGVPENRPAWNRSGERDGDGRPNWRGSDDNKDGRVDTPRRDVDKDGRPNWRDRDDTNDGRRDERWRDRDRDRDGTPNWREDKRRHDPWRYWHRPRPSYVIVRPSISYRYHPYWWGSSYYLFDDRYDRYNFDYGAYYRPGLGYYGGQYGSGWATLYSWLRRDPAARHWVMWNFDDNRNGQLGKNEARDANHAFDRLADRDRNGRVSDREVRAALNELRDEYRYSYRFG